MIDWQKIHNTIKGFLFMLINKEFLIFLCFLAISTSFWFLSTLNESYETEIKVPLKLTNIPENIVVTEDLPDSVRILIKDKGFNLLNYIFGQEQKPIHIVHGLYNKGKDHGSITPSEIQKIMKLRLLETTTIVSVKADHWDYYFCTGSKRRLPVVVNGSVNAIQNYYVARIQLTPDTVTVFANTDAFDTLRMIQTEPLMLENLKGVITRKVNLQHILGAKASHKEVTMTIFTDQLTELSFSVPIKPINVPDGVSLKTFPARAEVRVAVGMKRRSSIKAEQFTIVADYNEIGHGRANAIPVKIASQPRGIVKAFVKEQTVDYVVESTKDIN